MVGLVGGECGVGERWEICSVDTTYQAGYADGIRQDHEPGVEPVVLVTLIPGVWCGEVWCVWRGVMWCGAGVRCGEGDAGGMRRCGKDYMHETLKSTRSTDWPSSKVVQENIPGVWCEEVWCDVAWRGKSHVM